MRPCSLRLCVYLPCAGLWSAGSTPRLIVALPFARDWTLRWGLVRDRCESMGVGIQRRCVECTLSVCLPISVCDCVFMSRTCAALTCCCRTHAALSVSRSWWHNLMCCHRIRPYTLTARTRACTVGDMFVCRSVCLSAGLFVCPSALFVGLCVCVCLSIVVSL